MNQNIFIIWWGGGACHNLQYTKLKYQNLPFAHRCANISLIYKLWTPSAMRLELLNDVEMAKIACNRICHWTTRCWTKQHNTDNREITTSVWVFVGERGGGNVRTVVLSYIAEFTFRNCFNFTVTTADLHVHTTSIIPFTFLNIFHILYIFHSCMRQQKSATIFYEQSLFLNFPVRVMDIALPE